MASPNESTKLLLISKDPAVILSTGTLLAKEETLNLINAEVTLDNISQIIAETQPDVILFDFNFHPHPFDFVDMIVSGNLNCAVVAIISESEIVNLDMVVLSGARAFLKFPFQKGKLVITIKRVMELLNRSQTYPLPVPDVQPDEKATHMFTVFSPKGGAGTTTVATNLAISLHQTLEEDVLLVDGKLLFGHVALYLNLLSGNSISDLINHAGMLDQQLIEQVVVKHASGIHVLQCPNSINETQGIGPENLFKVIQGLQNVYSLIVVDGGNVIDENAVTFMDSSEKIFLVLNSDLASIRDASQFMDISATLSYPKNKVLLILNLIKRKANMKKEEVENILKMKIFGTIPTDERLASSSINEGVPILLKKPHHSMSKAFNHITRDLIYEIEVFNTEKVED